MKFIVYIVFLIYTSEGAVQPSIPAHLRPCYSGGGPSLGAPRRLDVFLSLLKKLERNSQLDARLFSAALLKSLRLDGIEQAPNTSETEFVLPYRASAFQFNKYKLLMDLFLPSQIPLEIDEVLTLEEKCLMHRMLSSTVRRWERGDENIVCPLSAEQVQNIMTEGINAKRSNSRCPIEDGVIQTEWGTIAIGTIVAAVASSLEAQRVAVTDILNAEVFKADVSEPLITSAKQEWFSEIETLSTLDTPETADISNVWVATIAGDLAEVVVNQGPTAGTAVTKIIIGSSNKWNDTLLPRDYYLFPQNKTSPDWHLTDAELLAGIDGDLAEVVVNQGPTAGTAVTKIIIGSSNKWNDTLLPRDYYLFPQNKTSPDWHLTDAELLAGIDGLILANYVSAWTEQRRTLRLSQIIEMYYSNEGAAFDNRVRACNRQSLLANVFTDSQVFTETSRFAHILSLWQGGVYVPMDDMDRISKSAVSVLTEYLPSIQRQYHKDCEAKKSVPEINLIVATDSSWKSYTVEQFMSWIGDALDMEGQRSTLALLQGNTGRWIVPPSNNLTAVFTHLINYTDKWPTRLNLPRLISSVLQYSLNATIEEVSSMASAGPSTVVLIVSPNDRPSSNDLENARELMSSLRASYFDVYFAYVSQDITDFQNINNEYFDYSELFLTTVSSSIHDVISSIDTYLLHDTIPTKIIGPHCPVNDTTFSQIAYEDFVLPTHDRSYRIHPFFLRQQPLVNVQFRNDGHGRLLLCAWRGADASHSCQSISEREVYTFNLTAPCPSPDFCPPARFTVTATSTSNICANNDCRFPNQVGYYLQHSGLRCLPLLGSANFLSPPIINLMIILIAFIFVL